MDETEIRFKPKGNLVALFKLKAPEVVVSGPSGTGKTRACLEKLDVAARLYPGMRGAIVRKTRQSMTQSVMVTWEKKVVAEDPGVTFRTTEQEYRYPRGSVIALAGMDKVSKILSTEFDLIFVNQAEELTEDDWEFLTSRLRHGVMPYQQIIGDCNPDQPRHWLRLRADAGRLTMLESRHQDNPELWNGSDWTTRGRMYIERLDALTGVRYLRLRKGQWAAAEGMVYEDWDCNVHLIVADEVPQLGQHLASVDWGFTNPGVIQVWGLDYDGRLYRVHEVYQTKRTIDWWTEKAVDLKRQYGVEVFVCDPSEPGHMAKFGQAGLRAEGAKASIADGVQAVQERLKVQGDGKPRLFFVRDALEECDQSLAEAKKPTCTEEEIDSYAWPKDVGGKPRKEAPVKVDDHGLDAARYIVMHVDRGEKRKKVRAWRPR